MRFKLTRRRFAFGLGLGAMTVLGASYVVPRLQGQAKQPLSLLSSIVDTIIPADESPGALDIALDQKLEALCQRDSKWQTLVTLVQTAVKDRALSQYQTAFSELDAQTREALVLDLLRGNSAVRAQVQKLRNQLMEWFYQSPAGHQTISYQLPSHYPAYDG